MRSLVLIIPVFLFLFLQNTAQKEKYPIPKKTNKLLFYIQRNHNANTIIYDANFDKNGYLVRDKAIDVYWLRYDEQGQRMELRNIEKWYAYGVDCEETDDKNVFKVELAADDKKSFKLVQQAAYKAEVRTTINGKNAVLNHLYIYADNSGVWPKVKYIEFFGNEVGSNEYVYEKLIVD